MTTVVPFTPSALGPFQFQPTLDGITYNAVVTWNLFAQRYYISLFTLDGTLIFNLPLIGSSNPTNLTSLSWSSGIVTAVLDPSVAARYRVGSLINFTISGVLPTVYNGSVQGAIVSNGPVTFTYALPGADPGAATQLGTASRDLSITNGYFNSTLVFRKASNQFEINP